MGDGDNAEALKTVGRGAEVSSWVMLPLNLVNR
jgi:hypothetical protein